MTFPNERPITQAELIELAENNCFVDFDDALDSAGYGETRTDFDFSMTGVNLVARPKPGNGGNVWGHDSSEWMEDPSVDQQGDMTPGVTTVGPVHQQAPGTPVNFPGSGSSIRMTGREKPPIEHSGIGKSESNDNFFAFLDEVVSESGESES